MSYIDGFVIPVPLGNKDAYIKMATMAAPIFLEHGAIRVVETWSDDIKPGKTNDFFTAVIAEEGEQVVFAWVEWPDKATRDAGSEKLMNDKRMQPEDAKDMPFSGARFIYGGFTTLLDTQEHGA